MYTCERWVLFFVRVDSVPTPPLPPTSSSPTPTPKTTTKCFSQGDRGDAPCWGNVSRRPSWRAHAQSGLLSRRQRRARAAAREVEKAVTHRKMLERSVLV